MVRCSLYRILRKGTDESNLLYGICGIWNVELLGLDLREYAFVSLVVLESSAASARTRLVSSANTASTSAASASVRSLLRSVSSRCVYLLKLCVNSILNMYHTLEPVKGHLSPLFGPFLSSLSFVCLNSHFSTNMFYMWPFEHRI